MNTNILDPEVTLSIISADSLATNQDRRILIIGQKLGAGTPGLLVEDLNFKDENELFGRKSHIAGMIRSAKKAMLNISPQPQIDAISLDDVGEDSEVTITSVSDSSGKASFASATLPSVDDFITISGYTGTQTYNDDFIVTVSGSGAFETGVDLDAGNTGSGVFSISNKATAVVEFDAGQTHIDGTITVQVGSKDDHKYIVNVVDTDSKIDIVDKFKTAINADLNAPFKAISIEKSSTTVLLGIIAENAGAVANNWGISIEGTVGLIFTRLERWARGEGDPNLTSLFSPVQDIRYTTIIWPEAYSITDLTDFLDPRFNASNDILDGVGIQVVTKDLAGLKGHVGTINSPSLNVLGNKSISITNSYEAPAIFGINDNMAAEIGAIRALRLTPNAPITQFVDASGAPADAFGGIRISSKPYHNTRLPNVPIALPGDYFVQTEQNDLIANGVSVFGANRVNNGSILGTQVTTYLTDFTGNPDTSFKFLNTVDQISIIREFYFENLRNNYQSARLTNGSVGGGGKKENENTIRAFCSELYQALAGQDVTQDGQEAVTDYETNLVVKVDLASGTVTINQKPLLVGQLRVIIGTIEVNFGN